VVGGGKLLARGPVAQRLSWSDEGWTQRGQHRETGWLGGDIHLRVSGLGSRVRVRVIRFGYGYGSWTCTWCWTP